MRSGTLKTRIERINGRMVKLVTLNALSKYVGLKSHTLRQWEKKGIMPLPSVTKPFHSKLFGECGRRLYFEKQAHVLERWMSRVNPNHGVIIKESMIRRLHEEWDEVTEGIQQEFGLKGDG